MTGFFVTREVAHKLQQLLSTIAASDDFFNEELTGDCYILYVQDDDDVTDEKEKRTRLLFAHDVRYESFFVLGSLYKLKFPVGAVIMDTISMALIDASNPVEAVVFSDSINVDHSVYKSYFITAVHPAANDSCYITLTHTGQWTGIQTKFEPRTLKYSLN